MIGVQNSSIKKAVLDGFLPALQELQKQGEIEICKVKRLELGNFNHEGYTLIVWKPSKNCR